MQANAERCVQGFFNIFVPVQLMKTLRNLAITLRYVYTRSEQHVCYTFSTHGTTHPTEK